jgi:hypothetical protein
VDVTRVVLETGRQISLTDLEISATYDRLLGGNPCARVNDTMILARARQPQARFGGMPSHVIEPERSYPDQPPGAWGSVELLPAYKCTGLFRSAPVDLALDAGTHASRLSVTWFQQDLDDPVVRFVVAAVAGLDWESLAVDGEK